MTDILDILCIPGMLTDINDPEDKLTMREILYNPHAITDNPDAQKRFKDAIDAYIAHHKTLGSSTTESKEKLAEEMRTILGKIEGDYDFATGRNAKRFSVKMLESLRSHPEKANGYHLFALECILERIDPRYTSIFIIKGKTKTEFDEEIRTASEARHREDKRLDACRAARHVLESMDARQTATVLQVVLSIAMFEDIGNATDRQTDESDAEDMAITRDAECIAEWLEEFHSDERASK